MTHNPSDNGPSGNDASQQRQPRHRVLKAGLVCFNDRHVTVPCVVRDMSAGGARLTVTGSVGVPDTFELYIELDASRARCEVTWRRGDTVGVRFTTPIAIEARKRVQVVTGSAAPHKPSLRRAPKFTPLGG